MGLIIVQEGGDPEQPKTLLVHKLSREDIYQRQGGKTGTARQPQRRAQLILRGAATVGPGQGAVSLPLT